MLPRSSKRLAKGARRLFEARQAESPDSASERGASRQCRDRELPLPDRASALHRSYTARNLIALARTECRHPHVAEMEKQPRSSQYAVCRAQAEVANGSVSRFSFGARAMRSREQVMICRQGCVVPSSITTSRGCLHERAGIDLVAIAHDGPDGRHAFSSRYPRRHPYCCSSRSHRRHIRCRTCRAATSCR
jgi:hypothetical protein